MKYHRNATQQSFVDSVEAVLDDYDDEYWKEVRISGASPVEFYDRLVSEDLAGIIFPERYGGRNLGVFELVLMMESIAKRGGWSTGLVGNVTLAGLPILEHGSEKQKRDHLPGIADGQQWSFAFTEPESGVNTANLNTVGREEGDGYLVNGEKRFIGDVDKADHVLLLARTGEPDAGGSKFEGLTTFIVDPTDDAFDFEEIPLDIYWPHTLNRIRIDDLYVPEEQVLGERGRGFYQLLSVLNAERIATAAQVWGVGRWLLDRTVSHANEREVWGKPIGSHQAIQHPLADSYAALETARLAIEKTASDFDAGGSDIGTKSNVANLQAGNAAWETAEIAMSAHGGSAAMEELGIAAGWQFIRISRNVPVPEEMIRNFLGHGELGLPKSY